MRPMFIPIAIAALASVALAQQPVLVQQAANSGSNLASLTVTLAHPPVLGNVLVVCHDSTAGSNSIVAGGGVSHWTLCQSTIPADNSEIWAGVVDNSPVASSVITLGGSPNSASAIVSEWHGLAIPLVFTGATSQGTDGTVTAPVTSATVQAGANDLVVAMVGVHSGGGETITSTPTQIGFADLQPPAPADSSIMAASFLVRNAAGPASTSWILGFAHTWNSAIVTFRAASGSGGSGGSGGVGAPELVQQRSNSASYVASLAVDLAQAPAAGDSLVVCLETTSGRNCTVSGGGVGNWTLCQSSLAGGCLLRANAQIWAGVVDGAPGTHITIGFTDGRNSASAIASEWAGLGTALSPTGGSRQGLGGTSRSPVVTSSLTAGPNDLVIACAGLAVGFNPTSPAAGAFTDFARPPTRLFSSLAAARLVPSASGPVATGWTLGFPDLWASCIVVFHRS